MWAGPRPGAGAHHHNGGVSRGHLVAAAALAVVSVALGAPPSGAAQPAEGRLAAVQAVLDARVAAVRRGDRSAFLATVDPRAPAAFTRTQARQYDGLRSIPLASYTLEAGTEDTGDLGRLLADRYGGAPVFLPATSQRYRLEGYDDRDAADDLWLTFVQRDGAWFVGGDTDLEAVGLRTTRHLWDLGPVVVRRGPRFMLLSHPEQAARAEALLALVERAGDRMAGAWDQAWSNRVPVILPGSVDELEQMIQSTSDLDKFVAFASYDLDEEAGYRASAPRVFIQDDRLARYPPGTQVSILVHELVHVAAASLAGPFIPLWLHEGVADWVAEGRSVGERPPPGSDGRLPDGYELATGSAAAIVRSYRESRSAIAALAARSGRDAPSALFRAVGEARVAAGSSDHQVDAALRRVAGLSLAELEAAWAARALSVRGR